MRRRRRSTAAEGALAAAVLTLLVLALWEMLKALGRGVMAVVRWLARKHAERQARSLLAEQIALWKCSHRVRVQPTSGGAASIHEVMLEQTGGGRDLRAHFFTQSEWKEF